MIKLYAQWSNSTTTVARQSKQICTQPEAIHPAEPTNECDPSCSQLLDQFSNLSDMNMLKPVASSPPRNSGLKLTLFEKLTECRVFTGHRGVGRPGNYRVRELGKSWQLFSRNRTRRDGSERFLHRSRRTMIGYHHHVAVRQNRR